jgi:prevent-host-death family protein
MSPISSSLTPIVWQLHEAKARFSELFRLVRAHGPQRIVKQGGEAVVVLSAEQFDQMAACTAQPESLVQFFQNAPTGSVVLDLRRKRDVTRDIPWDG